MSEMSLISHVGTHIDAPLHFIRGGASIDMMPLDTTIGTDRVIEINDPVSIKTEELKLHRIRRGERILFKTQNSCRVYEADEFIEDYVYLTPDAAVFWRNKGFDWSVSIRYRSAAPRIWELLSRLIRRCSVTAYG
jgi:arylformamidase